MDEAQAGSKVDWRNNSLRYADDTTLMAESEELKNLLMKVKEESEHVGLKLNIQKTKIMASGPITSWQMDGETTETVTDFIFLGSKITADDDCIHEIKRHLLAPWKKSNDQPRQHIKKQRHYFADKGPSSQSYGFSSSHVWMWELEHKEGWVPKNRCFQTVVLEKILESPLDTRRSNKSILKENNSEYLLEELMLKLKLQYFGHLIQTDNSLEKSLVLGKMKAGEEGGDEGWDGEWHNQLTNLTTKNV